MTQLPNLTPIISPWIPESLGDKSQLYRHLQEYGSPLFLVNTDPFVQNWKAYTQVLKSYKLDHQVCFARKANSCQAYVQAAISQGMGVDTASLYELKECLELGCEPQKLVVTASIKPLALIRLAVKYSVLLVLDNLDEVALVKAEASRQGRKAQVAFRVRGFCHEDSKLYSRFGFTFHEILELGSQMFEADETGLEYQGLHFHLNGYSIPERVSALQQTLELATELQETGLQTEFIDIGGGFLTNYLADSEQWKSFHQELERALTRKRPPITFRNHSLGLHLHDNKVIGSAQIYPYYSQIAKAEFLSEILESSSLSVEGTLADELRGRSIQIRLEPGRSLLDQSGITVASVIFRKRDDNGDLLVGLEMNGSQLRSASADFLLDPLVLYHDSASPELPPSQTSSIQGYLVGGYCLESDLLLKRKIKFRQVPEIGDLVIFVNTAGYMMNFYQTASHLYPPARVLEWDGRLFSKTDKFLEV